MKRKVKFRLTDSNVIKDGYIVKDTMFKEGYAITSLDGRNGYSVSLLDMLLVIEKSFFKSIFWKDTFSFGHKEFLRIGKLNKIMKKIKQ